jgi:hypothetical protein
MFLENDLKSDLKLFEFYFLPKNFYLILILKREIIAFQTRKQIALKFAIENICGVTFAQKFISFYDCFLNE